MDEFEQSFADEKRASKHVPNDFALVDNNFEPSRSKNPGLGKVLSVPQNEEKERMDASPVCINFDDQIQLQPTDNNLKPKKRITADTKRKSYLNKQASSPDNEIKIEQRQSGKDLYQKQETHVSANVNFNKQRTFKEKNSMDLSESDLESSDSERYRGPSIGVLGVPPEFQPP